MTTIKTSIALIALAAGVAACGSTATATSTKPTNTQSVNYNKSGPCNDLPGMLTEPKTTPSTPTADSCWANGIFVGSGSLKSKQIIFASRMADLFQYETTSAMFTNPKAMNAWKAQVVKYADSKVVTGFEAQLAIGLNKNETFALPPGNPIQNSGLVQSQAHECRSSVVLDKSSPTPQYLVPESYQNQKAIKNGKLQITSGTFTDVVSNFQGDYKMIGRIEQGQVPPCAS